MLVAMRTTRAKKVALMRFWLVAAAAVWEKKDVADSVYNYISISPYSISSRGLRAWRRTLDFPKRAVVTETTCRNSHRVTCHSSECERLQYILYCSGGGIPFWNVSSRPNHTSPQSLQNARRGVTINYGAESIVRHHLHTIIVWWFLWFVCASRLKFTLYSAIHQHLVCARVYGVCGPLVYGISRLGT